MWFIFLTKFKKKIESEIAFKKYVEDIIKTNYPNEKVKFSIRIFPNKKTNDGMVLL